MGRAPCCDKMGLKKGPWAPEEDKILVDYIKRNGHGNWRALPKQSGLLRCGKSCRLRWTNYLRPDVKRGNFTLEEEDIIINLHKLLGNRWSTIASRLPGRTDNEIKNVWNTHLKKRLIRMGIDPKTHTAMKFPSSSASSVVECSPRSLQNSDTSFPSLDCNPSTDSMPAVSTDNLATVSGHNEGILAQQKSTANSPSTLSDLSSPFYDSSTLSNDLFSSMSSEIIDETFLWGNHSLGDGEKWLPGQEIQCEPQIAKTEVNGEQSSTLQADYSMSVDRKDDLFSEIQSTDMFSELQSSMMDAADTIPHHLWNIDFQTDDSIEYWLNVLGKVGPLPPFHPVSQALFF